MKDYSYTVKPFRFPSGKMREAVIYDGESDFYTILISDILSEEARLAALMHAFFHIENGDFFSEKTVQEIEQNAHGGNR